ncbi:hypothetical protein PPERSA_04785 [Pseudocohnilembus persalinus]|uniref:Transmembrane protein n=1 Tax=Pseudocohnilembus persalinus TaxID=266149 RepID=A0A0V0Q9W4_PSEPJ|nr:hypothetical protein PPERSA_04785 [Pseudocohnilembus persalinus]|eukprot:KRW98852.1 hypothetical protein PPERSA_04785 [Pseudocohnilembus persalinus]
MIIFNYLEEKTKIYLSNPLKLGPFKAGQIQVLQHTQLLNKNIKEQINKSTDYNDLSNYFNDLKKQNGKIGLFYSIIILFLEAANIIAISILVNLQIYTRMGFGFGYMLIACFIFFIPQIIIYIALQLRQQENSLQNQTTPLQFHCVDCQKNIPMQELQQLLPDISVNKVSQHEITYYQSKSQSKLYNDTSVQTQKDKRKTQSNQIIELSQIQQLQQDQQQNEQIGNDDKKQDIQIDINQKKSIEYQPHIYQGILNEIDTQRLQRIIMEGPTHNDTFSNIISNDVQKDQNTQFHQQNQQKQIQNQDEKQLQNQDYNKEQDNNQNQDNLEIYSSLKSSQKTILSSKQNEQFSLFIDNLPLQYNFNKKLNITNFAQNTSNSNRRINSDSQCLNKQIL